MKPQVYASTYDRLRSEPAWRLLSANLASEVLALLQHLLFGTERALPASVLIERLTTELDLLRAHGRDLPGDAKYYLRDWLREGWLERRFPEGADEEMYELSAAAVQALRMVTGLQTQRAVATESRLALVMDQLDQLSRATETDPMARLEQLYEERRRIDAEIDAVASGEIYVMDPERAIERLREVIGLAVELSEDFRRVRDQFTDLNRQFRERIIQDEGQRGQVLADLFAGVDIIAESPAGRTFSAFWNLLTDPEQSAQLEASVDALVGREFVAALGREERRFLHQMTRTLLNRAGAVNDTHTGFARSLRNFVQSREYQEQRRLSQLMHAAKAEALAVREHLRPEQPVGYTLQLSSATYRSVGQWKLNDPAQGIVAGELVSADASDVALEDILASVEQADIDFRTLYANVRQVLEHASQVTIGGLLAQFPPPQGLGTIVGYLAIGVKHGEVLRDRREQVGWTTGSGEVRLGSIPLVFFVAERKEELHG